MAPTPEFLHSMLLLFTMIVLYQIIGRTKQRYGIAFGHEASFIALMGLAISYFYFETSKHSLQEVVKFNDDIFFYVCLPPLVFASGFNMQRKKFFENISNILLFGVAGTITTFVVFVVCTFWLQDMADDGTITITQTSWLTGEESPVQLTRMELMLMSALLCSTDVIAAISMVNYDEQPKLFSLLFGEGVVNDAVAIIIFNSVTKFQDRDLDLSTGGLIILDFFMLSFFSLLIGIIYGCISALMLKYLRMLTRDAIVECITLFCLGYLSYVTAETCKQSGIISLLTAGVIMGQYTWYNMSPQGKQGSALVFQFMGNAVQGFIFAYLGLTFFAYKDYTWSGSLALWLMPIIILGRFAGTLGLVKFMDLCGYGSGIRTIEVFFMGFAGLIRGAIAFGLVLRLDTSLVNREVIVTTALTIVVGTTIFFGSLVGLISGLTKEPEPIEQEALPIAQDDEYFNADKANGTVVNDSNAINFDGQKIVTIEKANSEGGSNKSAHDDIHHPNEENLSANAPPSYYEDSDSGDSHVDQNIAEDGTVLIDGKRPEVPHEYSRFKRCLFRLDFHYLKPFLVYKYSYKKQIKDDQFFDQFDKNASELKRMHQFVKQETMKAGASVSGAGNSYQYGTGSKRRATLSAGQSQQIIKKLHRPSLIKQE